MPNYGYNNNMYGGQYGNQYGGRGQSNYYQNYMASPQPMNQPMGQPMAQPMGQQMPMQMPQQQGMPQQNMQQQPMAQQVAPQQMGDNQVPQFNNAQQAKPSAQYVYVESVDEVKNYIMAPNSRVIFKDMNTNTIYEKESNFEGMFTITEYVKKSSDENSVKKEPTEEYVTKNDFEDTIKKIYEKIESVSKKKVEAK